MWFVTGAMLAYFPEFRGLGQGYFDVDKNKFDPFLAQHGISPLSLLHYARLIQLAVLLGLLLATFYMLEILLGAAKAFLAVGLMSSAPFFMGHSLVLNHEALLALCVVASILAMFVYVERGRKPGHLFVSAGCAAVAQLTKSSAVAMVPVIVLMLSFAFLRNRRSDGFGRALLREARSLATWLVSMAGVYILLWPGMWVAPGKMLYEVYGNALSYAFQGARLQVTQELQPAAFGLASAWPTLQQYVGDLLWRTTPLEWVGFVLGLGGLVRRRTPSVTAESRQLAAYLLLTAALFILMFSLAQGRNSPHYIMTSHLSLGIVAASGWIWGIGWASTKLTLLAAPAAKVAAALVLIAVEVGSSLSCWPYYFTYYNPLMALLNGHSIGYYYGEGMEEAAAHVAAKPDALSLAVFSYPARGPFSYFFPGETLILNPLFLEEAGMGSMFERLEQADYLVFYDALAGRTPNAARFVGALSDAAPEEVISVQGVENILIYDVHELPASFYDALGGEPAS
jgi:hypothetical protein